MVNSEFESELLFNWIDDLEFRSELSSKVIKSKHKRQETQKEVSLILGIPVTKIKQIEKGTCKDFNAILNYVNYFYEGFKYKINVEI